jgi:hypothetical protein
MVGLSELWADEDTQAYLMVNCDHCMDRVPVHYTMNDSKSMLCSPCIANQDKYLVESWKWTEESDVCQVCKQLLQRDNWDGISARRTICGLCERQYERQANEAADELRKLTGDT